MSRTPNVTLNNGIEMPQFGLGVFLMPLETTAENVQVALESGYRLIDTAAIYGNETEVGEGIRKSNVPRNELFITTKLWNKDHGYDNTLKAFESSLDNLGLNYIDLYLIHWPHPKRGQIIETWKAMEELYKSGKTKAIGVCNFKQHHLDELLEKTEIVPAILQIELNPTFIQEDVCKYAKTHNIQVESWYPLGGQRNAHALLHEPELMNLAKKYSKTPAQIALRWHVQLGLVTIPKSNHPERIKENHDIFDFDLTVEEIKSISALDTGTRNGPDPDMFNQE